MDSALLAAASACWLGILTSISPCPLATNIAAISYIGKRISSPRKALLAGLLYTLGRMVAYVAIGMLVLAGTLSIPDVAFFLQNNMNKILGPVLLIVGLVLLIGLKFAFPGLSVGERLEKKVESLGVWGAMLLGVLFALSFCPVSAALFFGSLIPLALEQQSYLVLPTIYGIGTALPVVAFALLISSSARLVGVAFRKLSQFEIWARRTTGVIFLLVGAYLTLIYLLGLDSG